MSAKKAFIIPDGNKYSLLGYKRVILDYHYSEFVPHTLEDANAQEIVDACENLGLDSLLLYAKDQWGNVYHDTKISHQHKNVQFDLFGQVLNGLKEKGIETIAYFTVNWDEGAAAPHPEWRVVSRNGKDVRDGGGEPDAAKWAFLCLNTGYREYALRQARELIENYDFAALFLDIILYWPGANDCYCEDCQKKWRSMYGGEGIPKEFTPEDQAKYDDLITDTLRSFCAQVKDIIEETGKDIMVTHNFGTFYDLDDYACMEIDPFGRDYFRSGMLAKIYRARMNGGEVELIGHRHNGVWDFTTKPALTLQWEAATAVANDCAIMYVDQPNIKGDLEPFVYQSMRKAFKTAEELAPHVNGTTPYAEIALLECERSVTINMDEKLDLAGAYKALVELHLPFDIVSHIHLSIEKLKQYDLLVISGSKYLDKEKRDIIKQYVNEGGKLLFCYQDACADEMGLDTDDKLFGMVESTGDSGHLVDFIKPVFKGAEEIIDEARLKAKGFDNFNTPDGAEVIATYTPPCIDVTDTKWVAHRPMPGIDTDSPAAVIGSHGKGQFAYFGWRIFKEYTVQDHLAMRQLFGYTVERLVTPRIRVEAPRVVESVFAKKDNTYKIFLINGISGKACAQHVDVKRDDGKLYTELVYHSNIDEIIPIHDIKVKLKGHKITGATNLAGESLTVSGECVSVPKVGLYDVITVETS